jgi:hypothetical protein
VLELLSHSTNDVDVEPHELAPISVTERGGLLPNTDDHPSIGLDPIQGATRSLRRSHALSGDIMADRQYQNGSDKERERPFSHKYLPKRIAGRGLAKPGGREASSDTHGAELAR